MLLFFYFFFLFIFSPMDCRKRKRTQVDCVPVCHRLYSPPKRTATTSTQLLAVGIPRDAGEELIQLILGGKFPDVSINMLESGHDQYQRALLEPGDQGFDLEFPRTLEFLGHKITVLAATRKLHLPAQQIHRCQLSNKGEVLWVYQWERALSSKRYGPFTTQQMHEFFQHTDAVVFVFQLGCCLEKGVQSDPNHEPVCCHLIDWREYL
eukprot:m.77953 g.77953  ORF g.77953 m.77953 type:complete len:208 (+) comp20712_c1_seq2:81-704(+)